MKRYSVSRLHDSDTGSSQAMEVTAPDPGDAARLVAEMVLPRNLGDWPGLLIVSHRETSDGTGLHPDGLVARHGKSVWIASYVGQVVRKIERDGVVVSEEVLVEGGWRVRKVRSR